MAVPRPLRNPNRMCHVSRQYQEFNKFAMGRTNGNRTVIICCIGTQSVFLQNGDDNASYENWRHHRSGNTSWHLHNPSWRCRCLVKGGRQFAAVKHGMLPQSEWHFSCLHSRHYGLLDDALRLLSEPSCLVAMCLLQSVSKARTLKKNGLFQRHLS